MHDPIEDHLAELFQPGNDSLSSYWIKAAMTNLDTAWNHCWSEKTRFKILSERRNLMKLYKQLKKEEKL